MASYSPYDNVTAQPYPNMLATAGLTDPRVTYWEPAKWIARLRANNTADTKILLCTNMKAGHAGASGRFDKLEEVALTYAFALWVSGRLREVARNFGVPRSLEDFRFALVGGHLGLEPELVARRREPSCASRVATRQPSRLNSVRLRYLAVRRQRIVVA